MAVLGKLLSLVMAGCLVACSGPPIGGANRTSDAIADKQDGIDTGKSSPREFLAHEVKYSGETLSAISKWYTGSANWKPIATATPGLSPHRLDIGQIVLVPQELVKREQALPEPQTRVAPLDSSRGKKVHHTDRIREVCAEYLKEFQGDEQRLKLLDEVLDCRKNIAPR